MRYQVGEVNNPKASDPWFEDLSQAIACASAMSSTDIDGLLPICVWDDQYNKVRLAYAGEIWRTP